MCCRHSLHLLCSAGLDPLLGMPSADSTFRCTSRTVAVRTALSRAVLERMQAQLHTCILIVFEGRSRSVLVGCCQLQRSAGGSHLCTASTQGRRLHAQHDRRCVVLTQQRCPDRWALISACCLVCSLCLWSRGKHNAVVSLKCSAIRPCSFIAE